MPAVREEHLRANSHLVPKSDWIAQRERERARVARTSDDDDDLSEDERADLAITTYCRELLRKAVKARRPFETFERNWDMFRGAVLPPGMPAWRGKLVLKKVRQIVLFLQASMTDNKPRINITPAMPGTEKAASLMGKLVDREWDVTSAQEHHSMAVFYGLVFGTGFVKWGRDPTLNGGRGGIFCDPVVPYRLFTNPGCTSIADAEYVIQVERKALGWIARHFPKEYKRVRRFVGGGPGIADAPNQRDLIAEGQPDVAGRYAVHTAVSMDGHTVRVPRESRTLDSEDLDEIDVYEFWLRDDATEPFERQKYKDGVPQVEPVKDDEGGYVMEPTGQTRVVPNPITGQPMALPLMRPKMRKVMETVDRPRYPNGRTVLMAGPVKLRDIPNPYEIDGFPYADWQDTNVGSIWGEGEPAALRHANVAMILLASMMFDNLHLGGNLSWLVNKASGISPEQIKNRPAAIFPVEDVNNALKAVERPNATSGFMELYGMLDKTLPGLAGLNDAIMGGAPPANTAFATLDNLTEQGAATIRLRVRNFEKMLTRSGRILAALIQQFDNGEVPLRREEDAETRYEFVDGEDGEREIVAIVAPASAKKVTWDFYTRAMLAGRVDLTITPDSSLATSPAGLFNKLMTLLDKKVIDQQYVIEKLNLDDGPEVLARMKAQAMLQMQAKKKPGPKPGAAAGKEARPPAAPTRHVPTTAQNAAVR